MTQNVLDTIIENLLKDLAIPETPETSATSSKTYSDEMVDLISHPGFQQVLILVLVEVVL